MTESDLSETNSSDGSSVTQSTAVLPSESDSTSVTHSTAAAPSVAGSFLKRSWNPFTWFSDPPGLVAEDYDLSHMRKRVRYFGFLGFALVVTFVMCGFGMGTLFVHILNISSSMTPESMVLASEKLKVLTPAAAAVTFGFIASLLVLARVSQQSKKVEESGVEFPSLLADLLKEVTGWVKMKAKGGE